jgi:hypothetical protein
MKYEYPSIRIITCIFSPVYFSMRHMQYTDNRKTHKKMLIHNLGLGIAILSSFTK